MILSNFVTFSEYINFKVGVFSVTANKQSFKKDLKQDKFGVKWHKKLNVRKCFNDSLDSLMQVLGQKSTVCLLCSINLLY